MMTRRSSAIVPETRASWGRQPSTCTWPKSVPVLPAVVLHHVWPLVHALCSGYPVQLSLSGAAVTGANMDSANTVPAPSAANVARLGFSEKDLARFLAKIDTSGPCWTWTGGNNGVGYGQFHWGKRYEGVRTHYAHRLAYQLWVGPLVHSDSIDHMCNRGNFGCVTPDHLRAVPILLNVMRSSRNIMVRKAMQTHCVHGHALLGPNLRVDARGRRHCRTCDAARAHNNLAVIAAKSRAKYWREKGYETPPPKRPRRTNRADT